MAAGNSGVPCSATCSSNSAGKSERATSTSAEGSFGERTILVGTAVSFFRCYRSFFMSSGKFDVNEYDLTVPFALNRTVKSFVIVLKALRRA